MYENEKYTDYVKRKRNEMLIADKGKTQGYVDGYMDGFADGFAKGFVQGRAHISEEQTSRENYEKKVELIKRLYERNYSLEKICRIFDMSESEVKKMILK